MFSVEAALKKKWLEPVVRLYCCRDCRTAVTNECLP